MKSYKKLWGQLRNKYYLQCQNCIDLQFRCGEDKKEAQEFLSYNIDFLKALLEDMDSMEQEDDKET